jgi:hypothetical protein
MVDENSECPECSKGLMKLILDTTELTPQAIETSLRARCTNCGHEEAVNVKDKN